MGLTRESGSDFVAAWAANSAALAGTYDAAMWLKPGLPR